MSRDLYVIALDLDAFRAIQGSGDQTLVRAIAAEKARLIAAHDDFSRHSGSPPFLPLMTAVTRIVEGTVNGTAAVSPQYEHAAALLADMLGAPVDNDAIREVVSDFHEDVDCVIRQRNASAGVEPSVWPPLADVMCRGPLLDIPLDPTARLGTGYLTPIEIGAALNVAEHADLDDPSDLEGLRAPEDALEIAAAYRDWLRAAANRHTGLFFHY